jgi:hypothetical protein
MKCRRDAGLIPHDQPVARWLQIWQHFGSKYRRLCRFCRLYRHGMEEVIGSIPIRLTYQEYLQTAVGLHFAGHLRFIMEGITSL